jgi:hypothetical protein
VASGTGSIAPTRPPGPAGRVIVVLGRETFTYEDASAVEEDGELVITVGGWRVARFDTGDVKRWYESVRRA